VTEQPEPDYTAITDVAVRRRAVLDAIARKTATVPKADHNGHYPGEWSPAPPDTTPPAAA
jgi:hypothetical protein